MKIKPGRSARIDFYATARLFAVCQSAERRNQNLSGWGGIHRLGKSISRSALTGRNRKRGMVVLSHAEDAIGFEGYPVLPDAFHILFTDRATHPGQIAQWLRATNVRAENRLHIVQVDDLGSVQVSDLLGRVCLALGPDDSQGSIIDAYLAGDSLVIRGPENRVLQVPVSKLAALRGQPPEVIRNFQLDPDGSFLHWPDLDVHLGWNQLLQAVSPEDLRRAQQKSADFNRRFGGAIRRLREKAGLSQSAIAGLTERQVRRIETGQCRATSNALGALAKAHEISLNDYLARIARELEPKP